MRWAYLLDKKISPVCEEADTDSHIPLLHFGGSGLFLEHEKAVTSEMEELGLDKR